MKFEILKDRHINSVIAMFTKAFCFSEPMTRYVGMQEKEFLPFAEIVTIKAAKDGLSGVMTDNDKVYACALVEDLMDPAPLTIPLTPKFDPILTLLENISSPYFKDKKYKPNEVAHLFITAVDETRRNKKLSQKVNFGVIDLAKQKNYSYMFSELTNFKNEKGIIKYLTNDKLLISEQIYKEFVFENQNPFLTLEGSAHSYIWALDKDKHL